MKSGKTGERSQDAAAIIGVEPEQAIALLSAAGGPSTPRFWIPELGAAERRRNASGLPGGSGLWGVTDDLELLPEGTADHMTPAASASAQRQQSAPGFPWLPPDGFSADRV